MSDTRREFVKKVAYTAPVIATLSVAPSLASAGSSHTSGQQYDRLKKKNKHEKPEFSLFKKPKHH